MYNSAQARLFGTCGRGGPDDRENDSYGPAPARVAVGGADSSACGATTHDGVKDGMIFNTRACRFDPKTLVCKGSKVDGCLSAMQAVTLEKAFAGPSAR